MTIRIVVAIAVMALAPAAAIAQTQPPPPGPPQPTVFVQRPGAFEQLAIMEGDIWRNSLSDQATVITSPARMNRAERLAVLVNAGRCPEARAIALQENDRRLARRISQICGLD